MRQVEVGANLPLQYSFKRMRHRARALPRRFEVAAVATSSLASTGSQRAIWNPPHRLLLPANSPPVRVLVSTGNSTMNVAP
jgi:hypothetical protein